MDNLLRFREVTGRICGSLDLDEALYDAFLYLKQELPMDAIFMTIYEYEKKEAKVIALAFDSGGFLVDDSFPLSDTAWASIKKWLARSKSGTIPWIRDQTHPINVEILKTASRVIPQIRELSIGKFSSITCALRIKNTVVGNLTFGALGINRYKKEHAQIVNEINEPFAIALSNALRFMDLQRDHRALQMDEREMRGQVLIGSDSGLKKVKSLIEYVAPTDSPVLLLGETGTGKEVVANEIHRISLRSREPFIRLNCGAIPDSLIDSELFGHEKGAFTGANETSKGRFERADKGTIFLDEIGELPVNAQVRLLRIIQSGEFERVGGKKTLYSNVRIIAATHRDLESMCDSGLFRRDLWYRLNVFPIDIPPLRSRKEDIPQLVWYFIHKKCIEMNLERVPDIGSNAMNLLMNYDWPGNVRELENIVEREIILSRGKALEFESIKGFGQRECHVDVVNHQELMTLDDAVKNHITFILGETKGKISGKNSASEILKIHPNTLRSKMEKLGIKFKSSDFF